MSKIPKAIVKGCSFQVEMNELETGLSLVFWCYFNNMSSKIEE